MDLHLCALREDSVLYLALSEVLAILLTCDAGTLQLRRAVSSGRRIRARARSASSPAAATWARASLCCAQPRRRSPACALLLSPALVLLVAWTHHDNMEQARPLSLQ